MALPASGLIKSPKTLFSRLLPCLTNWITGLYPEACRDWDKKAANFKKTWPFFKTFFTAANRDLRLMQTTSKQAGFSTEHGLSIRQHNDHRPESDNNIEAQGIAYIITDLAQSISEDKETIKSALTDMTVTIKSLQEKIETMKKKGRSRKRNNNNKSYCWTHGQPRKNNHTSSACNNKQTGYQDDATLTTLKRSSDKYCNDS